MIPKSQITIAKWLFEIFFLIGLQKRLMKRKRSHVAKKQERWTGKNKFNTHQASLVTSL